MAFTDQQKDKYESPFLNSKLSVNTNEIVLNSEGERNSFEPDVMGYRGRIGRQVTVRARRPQENKFYKVIIPYNFDEKRYTINRKEIEFYENRKYLMEKLTFFNENDAFQIEKDYAPKPMQKFCLFLPNIIFWIVSVYLGLLLSAFFSFNPVIVITAGIYIRKGFNSLEMFKFIMLEKFKIKEIHKILSNENSTPFCVNHKLKWILGQSGYWLEVQKLVE